MENLFDTLCSALAEPEAKGAFDEVEGVELMVLIMKAHNTASTRAIKVLDYACQTDSDEGKRCCEKFVEVAGLKALFAVLMGKVCPYDMPRSVLSESCIHRPTRNQKRHRQRHIQRWKTKNTSCPSSRPCSRRSTRTRCLGSAC